MAADLLKAKQAGAAAAAAATAATSRATTEAELTAAATDRNAEVAALKQQVADSEHKLMMQRRFIIKLKEESLGAPCTTNPAPSSASPSAQALAPSRLASPSIAAHSSLGHKVFAAPKQMSAPDHARQTLSDVTNTSFAT